MKLEVKDMAYQTSENIVYRCRYHVVWCTKYRRKILSPPYVDRLRESLTEMSENRPWEIYNMDVLPDHVHLDISCDPQFGILECVKRLKNETAKTLRNEFPELKSRVPSIWTREAMITSVGTVSQGDISKYLESRARQ